MDFESFFVDYPKNGAQKQADSRAAEKKNVEHNLQLETDSTAFFLHSPLLSVVAFIPELRNLFLLRYALRGLLNGM